MSKHVDRCANCGIEEIKSQLELGSCPTCHLVYYCSVKCLLKHLPEHIQMCKKREAELNDEKYNELLFKQPESTHMGDCPICFLPLPLDARFSAQTNCCFKSICLACSEANKKREIEEKLRERCPFCREPLLTSDPSLDAQIRERVKNRAKKNDPVAMWRLGGCYRDDGDHKRAAEIWTKAAELGDALSHFELAGLYYYGHGVERNEAKEVFHYEKSAIGGNPYARYTLGANAWNHKQFERAVRHWIIAAHQGEDKSLKQLKMTYTRGLVAKDDYAAALRGHQAAVDATKSPQREEAAALVWGCCEKQS